MSDSESLQQPAFSSLESTLKKSWEAPQLIVLAVQSTSNNSSGAGDADSALADS